MAIAILRRPMANDYLLELISSESEPTAIDALSALKIYKFDANLGQRIAQRVHQRKPSARPGSIVSSGRTNDDHPCPDLSGRADAGVGRPSPNSTRRGREARSCRTVGGR